MTLSRLLRLREAAGKASTPSENAVSAWESSPAITQLYVRIEFQGVFVSFNLEMPVSNPDKYCPSFTPLKKDRSPQRFRHIFGLIPDLLEQPDQRLHILPVVVGDDTLYKNITSHFGEIVTHRN